MRKIRILGLLGVIVLTGCSVAQSESGKYEAVSLGEGCAVNVQADSYQVACSNADPAKVLNALKTINDQLKENGK